MVSVPSAPSVYPHAMQRTNRLPNILCQLIAHTRRRELTKSKSVLLAITLLMTMGFITSGCNQTGAAESTHGLELAPIADMPDSVRVAGGRITQAYQLAVTHESLLREISCYCGCNGIGHRSNYDCYVAGRDADGRMQFDEHAVDCAVCVNITHDALRLYAQGKSAPEIRSFIDTQYSKFGPSTGNLSPVPIALSVETSIP